MSISSSIILIPENPFSNLCYWSKFNENDAESLAVFKAHLSVIAGYRTWLAARTRKWLFEQQSPAKNKSSFRLKSKNFFFFEKNRVWLEIDLHRCTILPTINYNWSLSEKNVHDESLISAWIEMRVNVLAELRVVNGKRA